MAGGGKKTKHGEHHDLALTFTAVLVIAGVMVLQILARRLKHKVEGQRHACDILEASERELSVLGLIAFGLFVLEQTATLQGDWLGVFHEVHFALFTVALFYVALNVSLYRLSRSRGRLWRSFEAADIEDHAGIAKRLHGLRLQLQIPALEQHLFFGTYWVRGLFRHPFRWLEYQRCLEHMTFHEVRRDFLRVHHLPHSFSFAAYLETCLQHVCLEFSEIRDTVWFLGILGLIVHLFFTTMLTTPSAEVTLTWLGATVIFLSVVAFLKVKWIYWYILHSELLFAGGDSPRIKKGRRTSLRRRHSKPESDSVRRRWAATAIDEHHSDDDDESPRAIEVYRRSSSVREKDHPVQLSLFWFQNPSFVVTLLELCLFALSCCVALLVYKMKSFYKSGDLATPFSVIAAAALVMGFLLPRIVPRFTLITHVGELSDPRRIAAVMRKQHVRGDLDDQETKDDSPESSPRMLRKSMRGSSLREMIPARVSVRMKESVEDPRISNASAVAVVAFVFCVAVTLDENSAGSVLENGHVIVIRDIELFLGCLFLIEAALRLWYRPRDKARQIDLVLVYVCVGCNIASFILRPAFPSYALHAISSAIVFRIFNTAWHNELAKPRFEHLRLSTKDLLESHYHHSTHHAKGSSHEMTRTTSVKSTSEPIAAPVVDIHPDDYDDNSSSKKQPVWVEFYNHPSLSNSFAGLGGVQSDLAALGDDDGSNKERHWAAEARATELLGAALATASADSSGTVDDVVERALRVALRRVVGGVTHEQKEEAPPPDTAVAIEVGRPPSKKHTRCTITSTQDEELEDSLYFNQVLKMAKATTTRDMKRRFTSLTNSVSSLRGFQRFLFHPSGSSVAAVSIPQTDDDDAICVQLVLTRDQVVWYDVTGEISELYDSGKVRSIPASDAENLTAVALNGHAARPDGYLHLSTILKVDVSKTTLVLTTTSHIAAFALQDQDLAGLWKSAILDAIEKEDDDDPVHPLGRQRSSASIVNNPCSSAVPPSPLREEDETDPSSSASSTRSPKPPHVVAMLG